MQVIQRTATVIGDLVGEVRPFRQGELRPQTTAIVQKIVFEPGQRVKLNQLLFVIDPPLPGKQFVTALDAGNSAKQRPVTLDYRVDTLWIVRSGLKPGERIMLYGG
jgi:multidrug efflux pump subunit AcrA (membrane-fusion protein)